MTIAHDAVGTITDPVEVEWTSADGLLYALSVGAQGDEPAYTTENTAGVDQRVLPTFPVVRQGASILPYLGDIDMRGMVHGSQAVEVHRPLPVEGTASVRTEILGIYDKGSAAVVVAQSHAADGDGALYSTRSTLFIRGEGGWGGDRGPATSWVDPPDREPDHVVEEPTLATQALWYRLNGDRHRLHSDPTFAIEAGFDRPIVHGLCTYGFAGRAVMRKVCDGDGDRMRAFEARFTSPVFPGEILRTNIWQIGDERVVFITEANGRVVLDRGVAVLSA